VIISLIFNHFSYRDVAFDFLKMILPKADDTQSFVAGLLLRNKSLQQKSGASSALDCQRVF